MNSSPKQFSKKKVFSLISSDVFVHNIPIIVSSESADNVLESGTALNDSSNLSAWLLWCHKVLTPVQQ